MQGTVRDTGPSGKGRQESGYITVWKATHLRFPASHLLPTGVEKVPQPHDIAVVQLTHNLQFSVLKEKGRVSIHPIPTSPSPQYPHLHPTPISANRVVSCPKLKAPRLVGGRRWGYFFILAPTPNMEAAGLWIQGHQCVYYFNLLFRNPLTTGDM